MVMLFTMLPVAAFADYIEELDVPVTEQATSEQESDIPQKEGTHADAPKAAEGSLEDNTSYENPSGQDEERGDNQLQQDKEQGEVQPQQGETLLSSAPALMDAVSGVSVIGELPEEAQLVVTVFEACTEADEETGIVTRWQEFDITLGGVQPDGTVKVSLPIPADFSGELSVWYMEDGTPEQEMPGAKSGTNYVFETDHFSVYALKAVALPAADEAPRKLPAKLPQRKPKLSRTRIPPSRAPCIILPPFSLRNPRTPLTSTAMITPIQSAWFWNTGWAALLPGRR